MEDVLSEPRDAGLSVPERAISLQRLLSWVTLVAICLIIVGGWVLNIGDSDWQFAEITAIKTSTLACGLAAALTLLAMAYKPPGHLAVVRVLACAIGAVGLYLMIRNIWTGSAFPGGWIAGNTEFEFLLFAVAIGLATLKSENGRRTAIVLAIIGIISSFLPLVAFFLDPQSRLQTAASPRVSPLAPLILIALFCALLLCFPREGWLRTLLTSRPAGRTTRRYVLAAIFGPIVVGFVVLQLTGDGFHARGLHPGVITTIIICASVASILSNASDRRSRQDITDLENTQLRAIIDSFDSAAVFVLNANGNLRMRNQLARDMFEREDQTGAWLLDEPFFTLADRRPLRGVENPVARLLVTPHEDRMLVGWTAPDGAERALNFTGIRLPTETRDRSLVILSIEDQTESWLLRTALSDDQRSEAVGQLTWGVAHEMANIFGIVQISAESARLETVSSKTGQNLEAILQACRRGSDLTHKLLEMTRGVEAGAEHLDATEVLKTVSDLAARVMPSFVEFRVQLPSEPCLLRCVRTDLESAALNLLANARNAIAEADRGRGQIELIVKVDNGVIEIAVTDDGPGIPKDLIDRVREPYFTTRQSAGGRGIGLTLVETFARRAGGSFELLANQPNGTRAVLRLTLSEDTRAAPDKIQDYQSVDLREFSVLVTESDPHFRNILSDGLRAMGAQITTAATGRDALDALDAAPAPDVLITNFKLPDGLEGIELARRLLQASPESRAIFLSGGRDDAVRSVASEIGLVLGKPIALVELANAINLVPPISR